MPVTRSMSGTASAGTRPLLIHWLIRPGLRPTAAAIAFCLWPDSRNSALRSLMGKSLGSRKRPVQQNLSAAYIPDRRQLGDTLGMPDKQYTADEVAKNRRLVAHIPSWLQFKDYTQAMLADRMGVSEGTLSKYLAGKQTMSVSTFLDIASIIGVPPEELMLPPGQGQRAARYRALAEALNGLPDDRFDAIVKGLLAMNPKP